MFGFSVQCLALLAPLEDIVDLSHHLVRQRRQIEEDAVTIDRVVDLVIYDQVEDLDVAALLPGGGDVPYHDLPAYGIY